MDEESKQLLREIRDLQKEQLELLKANLLPPSLRFQFSLRALLVIVTGTAVIMALLTVLYNWLE